MLGIWVGLLCATTWATSSLLLRDLARKLDPFTLNAPRSLIGGLFMFALTVATGRTALYHLVTPDRVLFLVASVLIGGGIGDTFYIRSMRKIGVSRAFPLSSTYPAFTLLFGFLFLRESVTLAIIAGLAMVLGGILLMSRLPSSPEGGEQTSRSGVAFALVASLCWATGMVLIAPGIKGLDSIMVASFRTPAMSLALWIVVFVRKTQSRLLTLTRREWVILVLGGLIGWGVGSVLFLLTVELAGPSRAAILTSTSPLFALPLSAIFLRERPSPRVLVGTVLTVLGVILVSS